MTNGSVTFDAAERIRWVGEPSRLAGFTRPHLVRSPEGVFLFHVTQLPTRPFRFDHRRVNDAFGDAPSFGEPVAFGTSPLTFRGGTRPLVGPDGTFATQNPAGVGVVGKPGQFHDKFAYIAPDGTGFYVSSFVQHESALELRFATSLRPEPAWQGRAAKVSYEDHQRVIGAVVEDGSLLCAHVPCEQAKAPFVVNFVRISRDGSVEPGAALEAPFAARQMDIVACPGGAWLSLAFNGKRVVYRVDSAGNVLLGPLAAGTSPFAGTFHACGDWFAVGHSTMKGVSLSVSDGKKVLETTAFVGAAGPADRGLSIVESPDGTSFLVAFDVLTQRNGFSEVAVMRAELAAGDPALDPPFSDSPVA